MILYLLEKTNIPCPEQYTLIATGFSCILCFAAVAILLPQFITWMKQHARGQVIRQEGPKSHYTKKGVPTMGGLVVIGVTLLISFLWLPLHSPLVWIVIGHLLLFAGVGWLDDIMKRNHAKGLRGSIKLILSLAILSCAFVALNEISWPLHVQFPLLPWLHISSPFISIPFFMVVILGTANASNLTDGLDGLFAGTHLILFSTMGLIAYFSTLPHSTSAVEPLSYASELVILSGALVGGLGGFLWYNCYPAQLFLGDCGALGLGATLGLIAVLLHQTFLLLLLAGLLVIETLSVMTQVTGYKLFKTRLFKMTPIHHHFELKGWHESQVTVRFWIITFFLAIVSVIVLLQG